MAQLEAQKKLKIILENYFVGMKPPIAWCTSAGPAEILRALGFEVYFPENHGAMLGASRLAGKYIPKAHQAGFAGEICSYLTADIGAWIMNETPLSNAYGLDSIPKPDMIVFNTNQCREVSEWFNFYGREFNCPVVGIYPPRYLEEEQIIGRKLDPIKLEKAVALSFEGTQLWKQVLETARNKPSPLSFFDGTILMAPIVMLRGSKICVDFYAETLNELKGLLNNIITDSNKSNQIRLYWEGMPIWGRLRSLAEFFAENNSAVVASTYCNSWIFDDFNPKNPLESMALAYTKIFINRGEDTKLKYIEKMLNEFDVDGIVFHDSKTCFNNTNSRFGLPKRLKDATGIDTLTIDGDLNDLRFFSDGQTKTKLETFIEQVKSKKGKSI
jgi:benzoyl-CoA reductase/2-hydroxyglutaryl-CoA dehydratase subunit BcrC/BadD/HgdB